MKIVYLISEKDDFRLFPKGKITSSVWSNDEGSYAWRCNSAFLLTESVLQTTDSIEVLKKIHSEVSEKINAFSGIKIFIHLGGLSTTAVERYNQILFHRIESAGFSDVEILCISRNNKYPSELFDDVGHYVVPSIKIILECIRKLKLGFNENQYEFVRTLCILNQIRKESTNDYQLRINTLQMECYYHHSQKEIENIKKEISE